MKKSLFVTLMLLAAFAPLAAEDAGVWTEAGLTLKPFHNASLYLGGEYRTRDGFHDMARWALETTFKYRIYKDENSSQRVETGYKFMRKKNPENFTGKEYNDDLSLWDEYNLDEAYTVPAHRFYVGINHKESLGRFSFTLRTRYQFTYTSGKMVREDKYKYSASNQEWYVKRSGLEEKSSKKQQMLRYRLEIEYNIPKCKLDPYCSIENYRDIDSGFSLDKRAYVAGVEYKIRKIHSIKLAFHHWSEKNDHNHILLSYNFDL